MADKIYEARILFSHHFFYLIPGFFLTDPVSLMNLLVHNKTTVLFQNTKFRRTPCSFVLTAQKKMDWHWQWTMISPSFASLFGRSGVLTPDIYAGHDHL